MQKQTSLYIPTPCHEDWNKMTPTQQGKFCGSCNKQVIDFSLMSDNQVLNFLSNQSGKLCGRFDAEQLQRPLIETKIKKKKSWWMALTMPLLFLFDKSEAQGNISSQADTVTQIEERKDLIVGKLIYNPVKQITVTGKVLDENDNALAYVSIIQKDTKHGTMTDNLGIFSIEINSNDSVITLVASYVGFETTEKEINMNEPEIITNMSLKPIILGDVVVTSESFTKGKIVTLGGAVAVCRRINPIDTIKTIIKKTLHISAFKIYPNPALKGSAIHLEINQPGEYELQLLNNQSRLINAEEINTVSERSTVLITIPSNISTGVYYLRLIDEQKKKSYTEKLIIQ